MSRAGKRSQSPIRLDILSGLCYELGRHQRSRCSTTWLRWCSQLGFDVCKFPSLRYVWNTLPRESNRLWRMRRSRPLIEDNIQPLTVYCRILCLKAMDPQSYSWEAKCLPGSESWVAYTIPKLRYFERRQIGWTKCVMVHVWDIATRCGAEGWVSAGPIEVRASLNTAPAAEILTEPATSHRERQRLRNRPTTPPLSSQYCQYTFRRILQSESYTDLFAAATSQTPHTSTQHVSRVCLVFAS
jgi:hypothetical protein